MKKRYLGIWTALFLLLGLCFSITALASYPAASRSKPIKAYGWQSRDYHIFSSSALTEKKAIVPYDECKIISIENNAAQVLYENGKETGWISLKRLIYDPEYEHQISYANTTFTLYKRPTVKAPYVTVPQFSGGITVSERGSWMEVLFKIGKQYYLGWIQKTAYTAFVRLSMETTKQPLADGTYIIAPRNAVSRAITCEGGTGKFSVSLNKKKQKQKFILKYVKGSGYIIRPAGSQMYLADEGGLSLSKNEGQIWNLTRSGGCFYIRSKNSSRALKYSAGKVSIAAFRKVKAQQWKFVKVAETPSIENSVVFSQYDPKWGGSTYYNGPTRKTISTSGCGVMALTNAVYALNGEFINPTKIAAFSASRGHYFYNQGTADTLYKDFARKYGKMYHFKHTGKTYSLDTVRKYLKKGSVAIALVPGHYIAIVGYRSADDSFLVLDSAVYGKRPTSIYGDWVSASTLGSGTMWCEYFHILSKQ